MTTLVGTTRAGDGRHQAGVGADTLASRDAAPTSASAPTMYTTDASSTERTTSSTQSRERPIGPQRVRRAPHSEQSTGAPSLVDAAVAAKSSTPAATSATTRGGGAVGARRQCVDDELRVLGRHLARTKPKFTCARAVVWPGSSLTRKERGNANHFGGARPRLRVPGEEGALNTMAPGSQRLAPSLHRQAVEAAGESGLPPPPPANSMHQAC